MQIAVAAIYSYLLGAIPSAYVIGKFRGKDITAEGSGNIGGTNAYRVLGARLGILVALLDVGKVILALTITQVWLGTEVMMFTAALAALIGHNWSIYVSFRGGKGIAVSVGIYLFLFPGLAPLAFAIALFNVFMTKYISLGSLNFVAVMALLLLITDQGSWFQTLGVLLLLVAVYRHRSNIKNLWAGKERQFGKK